MELDRFEVPIIPGKAVLGTKGPLDPSDSALLHPTAPAQHHERCDLGVPFVFVRRELRRREVLDDVGDDARHHQMGSTPWFEPQPDAVANAKSRVESTVEHVPCLLRNARRVSGMTLLDLLLVALEKARQLIHGLVNRPIRGRGEP